MDWVEMFGFIEIGGVHLSIFHIACWAAAFGYIGTAWYSYYLLGEDGLPFDRWVRVLWAIFWPFWLFYVMIQLSWWEFQDWLKKYKEPHG